MGLASLLDAQAFQDLKRYRDESIRNTHCAAWMDNTTIFTASTLMSTIGANLFTPLTAWDLATFVRAIVCYHRIYHHQFSLIDDRSINQSLGEEVLVSVPFPEVPTGQNPGRTLPDTRYGPSGFINETVEKGLIWLKRLNDAVVNDQNSDDRQELRAITQTWREALGQPQLEERELVDYQRASNRWGSNPNLALRAIDVTSLQDTQRCLEDDRNAARRRRADLKDDSRQERSDLLSDLNLRAYVNRTFAEFFRLQYVCSASRIPFKKYLFDRAMKVRQELITTKVIEDRYAQVAAAAQLRVPIFLALTLRNVTSSPGLWGSLATLRKQTASFRNNRETLERELLNGNLKEAARVAKALQMSVDSLLKVVGVGVASTEMSSSVLENALKGNYIGVAIAAIAAAAKSR